jgi:hypothetical protein
MATKQSKLDKHRKKGNKVDPQGEDKKQGLLKVKDTDKGKKKKGAKGILAVMENNMDMTLRDLQRTKTISS